MIVKIQGGLGNQMFQYAFAKSLALKYKKGAYLDDSVYETNLQVTKRSFKLDIFSISLSTLSEDHDRFIHIKNLNKNTIFNRIRKKIAKLFPNLCQKIKIEKSLLYDNSNMKLYSYYEGYWQSEKYFKKYDKEIRKDFMFINTISLEKGKYFNEIACVNSVSIHIRRGDYVNNPIVSNFHGSLSTEYYEKAILYVIEKVQNPVFFVFSDDIQWVKTNMFKRNDIRINFVITISEEEDLFLMSKCRHNIIANSSFSWWGAYLNENENKIVIAPKLWFKDKKANDNTRDLIPNNWLRL